MFDTGQTCALGYGVFSNETAVSAARARIRGDESRASRRENADGRRPQDGQIRTLFALRRAVRSEADAGPRVLRRAHGAGRKGAQALGRVRIAWNGEAGGAEAQGAD